MFSIFTIRYIYFFLVSAFSLLCSSSPDFELFSLDSRFSLEPASEFSESDETTFFLFFLKNESIKTIEKNQITIVYFLCLLLTFFLAVKSPSESELPFSTFLVFWHSSLEPSLSLLYKTTCNMTSTYDYTSLDIIYKTLSH